MRDARHRGAAAAAERALERGRGRVMDDVGLTRAPAEVLALDPEARAEQRAVLLAAHRAVAMSEPKVRRPGLEAHGAAETRAADHVAHAAAFTIPLSSQ